MFPKALRSLLGISKEPEASLVPPAFRLVTHPEKAFDFLLVENFLTSSECDFLVNTFKRLEHLTLANPEGDPFWDHRFLWFTLIPPAEVETKRLMQRSRHRIIAELKKFYREAADIYSDTIQLVMWPPGLGMPVHADNSHPDGAQHGTPFRDYASVVYLNDEFDEGEFFFECTGLLIKPKKGLLVAFRGGAEHRHGVRPASNGTRYTMPGWYTKDLAHADESSFNEY